MSEHLEPHRSDSPPSAAHRHLPPPVDSGDDERFADRGHTHGVDPDADRRLLTVALALIVGFMGVEVVVAALAGLADAGHMLTDAGAIAGSIWALRLAQRPHTNTWSYGLRRAEILAAAANGGA